MSLNLLQLGMFQVLFGMKMTDSLVLCLNFINADLLIGFLKSFFLLRSREHPLNKNNLPKNCSQHVLVDE